MSVSVSWRLPTWNSTTLALLLFGCYLDVALFYCFPFFFVRIKNFILKADLQGKKERQKDEDLESAGSLLK